MYCIYSIIFGSDVFSGGVFVSNRVIVYRGMLR